MKIPNLSNIISVMQLILGIITLISAQISWQNKRRIKLICYEILCFVLLSIFIYNPVIFLYLCNIFLKAKSSIFYKYLSTFLITISIPYITMVFVSSTFHFVYETTKGDIYYYYYLDGRKKYALQYSNYFIDKLDKDKLQKITIIDPNLIYWKYEHGKMFNVFDKWFKFLSKHIIQLFLMFFSISYLLSSLYIQIIIHWMKYSHELSSYLSKHRVLKIFKWSNRILIIICIVIIIVVYLNYKKNKQQKEEN